MAVNKRYIGIEKRTDDQFSSDDSWTALSSNAHYIDQVSEDIGQDRGFIYPDTSAGRVKRSKLLGPIGIEGDVQVPVYTLGTPTLIYYAMGGYEGSTANRDGPASNDDIVTYNHSLKPSGSGVTNDNGTPINFNMEIGKDLKAHRFIGCVVKSMTLDYDPSEVFLSTFNVLCRQEMTPAATTTADNLLPDYNIKNRSVAGTEIVTKVGGTAITYVESASIEVDNQFVDDHFALGSRYLPNKYVQGLEVTGSFEFGYNDIARYTDVLNEVSPKYEFEHEYGASGTNKTRSANYRKFAVILQSIALDTGNLPTEGSDRYMMKCDFTSQRTSTSDVLIEFQVTNEETIAALIR